MAEWRIQDGDIEVIAYDYLAGAIGSVKYRGVELIDNVHGKSDHGRQLQTAVQYQDGDGAVVEDYNPTEAGASGTFIPGDSKSVLLGAGVTNENRLETQCQAAFWLPYKGRIVSDTIISKSVAITPWGLDYRVKIDPTGADEVDPTLFNAEIVTGYMPTTFSQGGFVRPDGITAALTDREISTEHPCYLSNQDGSVAMGVLLEGAGHYAILKFPDEHHPVNKWSVVVTDTTPDPEYEFAAKVFIGSRQQVVDWLRGGELPTSSLQTENNMTDCAQDYLNRHPDVANHPYFGSRPREHFDNHGRQEGRQACTEWQLDGVGCEETYLSRYPDVANSSFADDPRLHYIRHGKSEGRIGCDHWNSEPIGFTQCELDYLSAHPDVESHPYFGENPKEHYDNHGRLEGRSACDEWQSGVDIEPEPEPPLLSSDELVIIDTDMSPTGDPDDVQCYIAQASSWPSLWNIRGIVSTTRSGVPSGREFIERINLRMHNEVSQSSYPVYDVYEGSGAVSFYRQTIWESAVENKPCTIFVWGSVVNLTAALRNISSADIAHTTVYWVANWNRYSNPEYQQAWNELKPFVPYFAAFYRDEEGFRGIMRSGDVSKLDALQQYILQSPVAPVYRDHPIPAQDATFHNRWKAGDLSLYFYHRNPVFRNSLFKPDQYGGFVADGLASEQAVASDGFRDEMIRIVKQNVDRV